MPFAISQAHTYRLPKRLRKTLIILLPCFTTYIYNFYPFSPCMTRKYPLNRPRSMAAFLPILGGRSLRLPRRVIVPYGSSPLPQFLNLTIPSWMIRRSCIGRLLSSPCRRPQPGNPRLRAGRLSTPITGLELQPM